MHINSINNLNFGQGKLNLPNIIRELTAMEGEEFNKCIENYEKELPDNTKIIFRAVPANIKFSDKSYKFSGHTYYNDKLILKNSFDLFIMETPKDNYTKIWNRLKLNSVLDSIKELVKK